MMYIKTRENLTVFVYKTGCKHTFCLHEGLAGYWQVIQDKGQFVLFYALQEVQVSAPCFLNAQSL